MKYSNIILFIIFLSPIQFVNAQLQEFTLNVTVDNHETCPSNGSLIFEVTDVDTASTIVFSIYKSADLVNPVGVTENLSFGGLSNGDYIIIATQTLNGASNTQTELVSILYQVETLSYSFETTNEICGNDGKISIEILSGKAESFEIFSGPMIFPPQSENNFVGLVMGDYTVKLTDVCNNIEVVDINVGESIVGFVKTNSMNANHVTCDTTKIGYVFKSDPGSIISYPVEVKIIIHPPTHLNLPDVEVVKIYESGYSWTLVEWNLKIPYYGDHVQYYYDMQVTDGCDNILHYNNISVNIGMAFYTVGNLNNCNLSFRFWGGNVLYPFYMEFLESPSGFDPTQFNSIYPGPFTHTSVVFENDNISAPEGHYKIRFYDECNEFIMDRDFNKPELECWFNFYGTDCQVGYGFTMRFWKSNINSAEIISAPSTFNENLPFDISQYIAIDDPRGIRMNSLPGGEYTIVAMDSCGNTNECTAIVLAYEEYDFKYRVVPKCGAFDILLHDDNNFFSNLIDTKQYYWLQIMNDDTGIWENLNGTNHIVGISPIAYGGFELINKSTTSNIVGSGHFRILRTMVRLTDGTKSYGWELCEETMVEFDYEMDGLNFDYVYSFICDDGSYSVACVANGVEPISYRITTKNGETFNLENGTDAVFTGLNAGLYNFQIEDPCGNILNREIEVTSLILPNVSAELCEGTDGQLSVIDLPFLDYEWWKSGTPNTILSTSAVLDFTSFNSSSDNGEYNVRLSYNSSSSCIDQTLSYAVPINDDAPNAGDDKLVDLCNDIDHVDLNSMLDDVADNYGLWYNEQGIQVFDVSNLYIGELSDGEYQYKYFIDGICEGVDSAFITLLISTCNLPPVAICHDLSISLIDECTANVEASIFDNGSYDPLDDELVFYIEPGGPFDVGVTEVTFFVDDGVYIDSCTAFITVEDTSPPTVICQDITVELDSTGNAIILAADIDFGSYDGCEIASYELDKYEFSRVLDVHEVTLIVTDIYGNSDSCVVNVTITGDDADCDNVHDAYDLCNGGDDTIDNDNDGLADCAYPPDYNDVIEDWKCGEAKVYICHYPPGNTDNLQTICISQNAISTHFDNHEGDYLGQCHEVGCVEEFSVQTEQMQAIDNTAISLRDDNHGRISLQISPNPSLGHVVVTIEDINTSYSSDFKLMDINGRIIWSERLESNFQSIVWQKSFDLLSNQVYFFIVQNNNNILSKKIVILN